jgi:hypothetical protein|tara:strand:- start:1272 stop:1478 length:207 start_codon:yes stop_codon:yes gene_type:complete
MATYAMETKSGDILVDGIVQTAIKNKFTYDWVVKKLMILSNVPEFDGAMDTMVREAVIYELDKHGVVI